MTTNQTKAAVAVIASIYEAVASVPGGVPAGTIYAVLMTQGCTLQQYEQIEALMIRVGMLRREGDVLHANPPGSQTPSPEKKPPSIDDVLRGGR